MSRALLADNFFAAGYNCAQSVFLAFAPELGYGQEQAARLTSCLGGGFSGTGGVCGALASACLALSAIYGREQPQREGEQLERQERTRRLVQKLQRDFSAQYGGVLCEPLLAAGLAASGKLQDEKHLCAQYVRYAAQLAEILCQNPPDD